MNETRNARNKRLKMYHAVTSGVDGNFSQVFYRHIGRDSNTTADELAKRALNKRFWPNGGSKVSDAQHFASTTTWVCKGYQHRSNRRWLKPRRNTRTGWRGTHYERNAQGKMKIDMSHVHGAVLSASDGDKVWIFKLNPSTNALVYSRQVQHPYEFRK